MPMRPSSFSMFAPPRRLAVFLDIDGVLHSSTVSDQLETLGINEQDKRRVAFVRGELQPSRFGMLVPHKLALLTEVLRRYPHVVIVISSAWRFWRGYRWVHVKAPDPVWERENVDNLNWLKALLDPVLAERIIGKTGQIFNEASGDLNWHSTRLDEIQAYMREHGETLGLAANWIAIDDQARHFTGLESCVFQDEPGVRSRAGTFPAEAVLLLDGLTGLTEASAAALDAALQRASACMAA